MMIGLASHSRLPLVLLPRAPLAHYYPGELNVCASCGSRQWYVGRKIASCARCEAPLPINIAEPTNTPFPITKAEMEAA